MTKASLRFYPDRLSPARTTPTLHKAPPHTTSASLGRARVQPKALTLQGQPGPPPAQHTDWEQQKWRAGAGTHWASPSHRGGRCSPRRWHLRHTRLVQEPPVLVPPRKGVARGFTVSFFQGECCPRSSWSGSLSRALSSPRTCLASRELFFQPQPPIHSDCQEVIKVKLHFGDLGRIRA